MQTAGCLLALAAAGAGWWSSALAQSSKSAAERFAACQKLGEAKAEGKELLNCLDGADKETRGDRRFLCVLAYGYYYSAWIEAGDDAGKRCIAAYDGDDKDRLKKGLEDARIIGIKRKPPLVKEVCSKEVCQNILKKKDEKP